MNSPTRFSLALVGGSPILYFGTQLAAMPWFPGYDPLLHPASLLGSDRSLAPAVFNSGAVLVGVALLGGSVGMARGLVAVGSWRPLAWIVAVALMSSGAAAIWAGSFPMPDPRHNPGALGVGTFAAPLLLLVALWRVQGAGGLRRYLLLDLAAFAGLAVVMAGLTAIDPQRYGGLLQRVAALIVYVPPGVVGWWLWRRWPAIQGDA